MGPPAVVLAPMTRPTQRPPRCSSEAVGPGAPAARVKRTSVRGFIGFGTTPVIRSEAGAMPVSATDVRLGWKRRRSLHGEGCPSASTPRAASHVGVTGVGVTSNEESGLPVSLAETPVYRGVGATSSGEPFQFSGVGHARGPAPGGRRAEAG